MAEVKPGCKVEIILNCYDENGQMISSSDTDWYGFDRQMANDASRALVTAVVRTTEEWDRMRAQEAATGRK